MTLGADVVSSTSGAERSGAQALPGTATFTPSTLALPGVVWSALLCVTVDFACLLIMQWVSWWGLAVVMAIGKAAPKGRPEQCPSNSPEEDPDVVQASATAEESSRQTMVEMCFTEEGITNALEQSEFQFSEALLLLLNGLDGQRTKKIGTNGNVGTDIRTTEP